MDYISIERAREHNLKNVSIKIPKNKLVVITGPSGSGKSSLAFDTLYAEGQRRYIESLSSYARQFLGAISPANVDRIEGLSPAIAIDQKGNNKNPRSTVGTITEIFDYLRVLYSRIGDVYCPVSQRIISKYSPSQVTNEILKNPESTKIYICFSHKLENKNSISHLKLFLEQSGFRRFKYNDVEVLLEDLSDKTFSFPCEISVILDRLIIKDNMRERLVSSVEQAFKYGHGHCHVYINDKKINYSEILYSKDADITFPDFEPRHFSFNSPLGACQKCNGLGISQGFTDHAIIFDKSLPLLQGAIPLISKKNNFIYKMILDVASAEKINLNLPYKDLPRDFRKGILFGTKKIYKFSFTSENSKFEFKKQFQGVIPWLEKKYLETESDKVRKSLEEFMEEDICNSCQGKRLGNLSLQVKLGELDIMEVGNLPITESLSFFTSLKMSKEKEQISINLLKEIRSRLSFLNEVGLGYLTLNRSAQTISGGESQRIRLATQIGSALTGIIYVLDEPSIGLHARDTHRLIATLKHLRSLDNTIIVVEHDEETIAHADFIIDLGPGSGIHGGEIIASGSVEEIKKNLSSITGRYLNDPNLFSLKKNYQFSPSNFIDIKGATCHNIKNLNVAIPLQGLICLTGVSGSGKSTLLEDILVPALSQFFSKVATRAHYNSIIGLNHLNSYVLLDQGPIGRTPHSNLATYTGIFDQIREVFAQTPESKVKGYQPGRFSFNVKGGRCEDCEGDGIKKIEMHFLPDVYVTCSECGGSRYNVETLLVLFRGKNIADILQSTVEESYDFFKNHPKISRTLKVLLDIGLGYLKLGQPATTLSGGEAQRLKLARELSRRVNGHCLYILDEPTTGLHTSDVKILLSALLDLVALGHTVFVIEHNLHVIRNADYIIDLGPEGGDQGGQLVAFGTPEEVALNTKSFTGQFLKNFFPQQTI